MIRAIRALGPIDLKNIRRDSMLIGMAAYPILITLVLRLALPLIQEALLTELGFDLEPYIEVLAGAVFVLLTPALYGIVIGFLMLDERDDRTLLALRVTPLQPSAYVAYRLGLPMLISIVATVVMVPLSGLMQVALGPLVLVAVVASLQAPLFALVLPNFAANKVAGFALMKGMGPLIGAPMIAYFVPAPWDLLFALLPTTWPVELFWALLAGEPWMGWLVGAVVVPVVITAVLMRRFNRMVV